MALTMAFFLDVKYLTLALKAESQSWLCWRWWSLWLAWCWEFIQLLPTHTNNNNNSSHNATCYWQAYNVHRISSI